MSNILTEIVDWLHQQQDWLQEAAELLYQAGSLSDADINRLAARLHTEAELKVTTQRSFDWLAGHSQPVSNLHILSLGEIKGIENLAPRKPLHFGSGNLVVIYGPNGSGKSSFTRILKKACGKPHAQELKTNVFQTVPADRQCKICFRPNSVEKTVKWHPDDKAISELQAVDFFDADAATFYLSKETKATYSPPIIALLEGLAAICDRVKAKLQGDKNLLVSALPALPQDYQGTKAGTAYVDLKATLSKSAIKSLIEWSNSDQAALDQLVERLKVVDPTLSAKQKRATKVQVDKLLEELNSAATALNADQLQSLRIARKKAQEKRSIAAEAAKTSAQSSLLEGVGSDTWNAMWLAARQYSQIPYPDQEFPVTTPGARCVLCHHELTNDAQQRLRDFEAFVQGIIEAEAKDAENHYDTLLKGLPVALSEDDIRMRCEAAGQVQDSRLDQLSTFWIEVGKASEALKSGETKSIAAPVVLPTAFIKEFSTISEALEQEAKQYDQDAKVFDRAVVISQKKEIETRKWTSQQSETIFREIERLNKVMGFDNSIRAANSRPISLKAGEIAEKFITKAYVNRFNAELKTLGAAHIRVELVKTRIDHGKALYKLCLKSATSSQISPESVLSDGERRIVSLAAFLADVAEKPYAAPFLFDDPISSLDHDFEWYVAKRLAELAKSRQVLVFTHRLSLYGAMEDAAKRHGDDWRKRNLEKRYIESFGGVSGHPTDEATWNANTKTANNILITRLTEAAKAAQTGGGDAYRLHAQGICTDFRKLLERTVEDDLLNEVVKRHRRSVTTDNRIGKLPRITPEDCSFIDQLMTKYSCFEHSQSQETPVFLPEEPELRQDIEALNTWRKGFHQRGGAHA